MSNTFGLEEGTMALLNIFWFSHTSLGCSFTQKMAMWKKFWKGKPIIWFEAGAVYMR